LQQSALRKHALDHAGKALHTFGVAKKWSNQNLPGALHFVTGNLINRKPFFIEAATCVAFFKVLNGLENGMAG